MPAAAVMKERVAAFFEAAKQHPVAAAVALIAVWPIGTLLITLLTLLAPFIAVGGAVAAVGVVANRGAKPAANPAPKPADPPATLAEAAKAEPAKVEKSKAASPVAAVPPPAATVEKPAPPPGENPRAMVSAAGHSVNRVQSCSLDNESWHRQPIGVGVSRISTTSRYAVFAAAQRAAVMISSR